MFDRLVLIETILLIQSQTNFVMEATEQ